MIKSRLAFCYFILVVLLTFGCSSTPTIIEKPVIVLVPEIKDTAIVLRDTITVLDSAWYGEVTDSLGKVIGDLTVYFKKKIASINIKRDTLYVLVKDTISNTTNLNPIIPIISDNLSWWESFLFFGGMGLLTGLIAYLRLKRGKLV
jgi:hypothetical protein